MSFVGSDLHTCIPPGSKNPNTRNRRWSVLPKLKFLRLPANESSTGLVLSLSVVVSGLMSIALVWQAEIIANQREVIRWLEGMKIGT